MKRVFALSALAAVAVVLISLASSPSALAGEGDRVIIPESSIEHSGDIGVRAHTNLAFVMPQHATIGPNGAPVAENPATLACIYKLVKQTKGCPKTGTVYPTGGAKAIALVDAFDNPDIETDIAAFAAAYGYSAANFTKVKIGNPPANADWSVEESLDVEYSFAMAPKAQIYLVEAESNSFTDLLAAEDKATELVEAAGGGEVSNSWGGSEFSGETSYDSHFKGTGIVYFASSGDTGGAVGYPSTSPYVVSAGGTQIDRNSSGDFTQEVSWSDAGGGPSTVEKRPNYQNVIQSIVGTHRGTPDISSNAAYPGSPVAVYNQYYAGGWILVGGTSVSSPTISGIVNAAGHFYGSTKDELNEAYFIYNDASKYKLDYRNIISGSNGYACKTGWTFCAGIGSPLTYNGK
jgi:kumamolisin